MKRIRTSAKVIFMLPVVSALIVLTAFTISRLTPQEDLRVNMPTRILNRQKNAVHAIRDYMNNGHRR